MCDVPRRLGQTVIVLLLGAVLAIWLDTSGTLSSFTVATVRNTNSAALSKLSISHTYPNGAGSSTCTMPQSAASPATQTCAGSLLPSTVPATKADTILNNGTLGPGSTISTFGLSACGPRQLANSAGSAVPLLPRRSTLLNWTSGTSGRTSADSNPLPGAGSVTFTAAGSDYASTTAQVPDPVQSTGLLANAGAFGVWFKTNATSGGLLSFDTVAQVPSAATGNNAFALYLSAGRIGLRTSPGYTTPLTANTVNDGAWHFVYATVDQTSIVGLGVTTTARIYLDGIATPAVQVAPSLGQLLGPPVSPLSTGYWLAGWSQLDGYLTGSESDFVVSTNTAPATSTALFSAATQAAFAAATTPTALWPLNDEGNSVYAGSYPIAGGAVNPCTTVNVTRNGTTQTLAATVTTPITATIPAPGTTASYDTALAQGTGYPGNLTYATGLQIYAPTRFTVSTTTGAWRTVFDWNASGATSPASNPNISPTFVIT